MSRPSTIPASTQRTLSLTEELEKLEQSITLTLQEIDHNFSRAHRIVTSSILPIVEQYAEGSKAVWEGSKFWKQFFEASANVSLSGYEEGDAAAGADLTRDTAIEHDEAGEIHDTTVTSGQDENYGVYEPRGAEGGREEEEGEESAYAQSQENSLLSSPSMGSTTPRAATGSQPTRSQHPPTTIASYPSPYETLKKEYIPTTSNAGGGGGPKPAVTAPGPTTPRAKLPNMSMTPLNSSPFEPEGTSNTRQHTATATAKTPGGQDPLLHRILDKNYRLQATPHSTRRRRVPSPGRLKTKGDRKRDASPLLSSPDSDDAPPELHAEIFSSPVRRAHTTPRTTRARASPRPGISVLASARKNHTPARPREKVGKMKTGVWDSDSDDEEDDGGEEGAMSPPKTMQFVVPTGRLMRTPAREASQRIVADLLLTAGANDTTDEDLDLDLDLNDEVEGARRRHAADDRSELDSSPSLVRGVGGGGVDDTF
ncbi:MAG: DASH complex subunit ask1 [Caeruleum heppii]|nr:MAG: DASH complex subunit ask1 [Caeruleum heppii]